MHSIQHQEYPATWTLKQITADVTNYVQHHGDCYGTTSVRVPTQKVFGDIDEAADYLRDNINDYDGLAVQFLEFDDVEDTEKIKELKRKISDTLVKKQQYFHDHSVRNRKAAYIGCPNCGSKLNREKLSRERCPVCYAELRSAETLKHLASFDDKIKGYQKKITQELLKQKEKAQVKWLVQFAYHC